MTPWTGPKTSWQHDVFYTLSHAAEGQTTWANECHNTSITSVRPLDAKTSSNIIDWTSIEDFTSLHPHHIYTMASKLAPLLIRASTRALRPARLPQFRGFAVSARAASDTLQVVSLTPLDLEYHTLANGISLSSIATATTITRPSPLNSMHRMKSSSRSSSRDTQASTRKPPSCPFWTSASANSAGPASAS